MAACLRTAATDSLGVPVGKRTPSDRSVALGTNLAEVLVGGNRSCSQQEGCFASRCLRATLN